MFNGIGQYACVLNLNPLTIHEVGAAGAAFGVLTFQGIVLARLDASARRKWWRISLSKSWHQSAFITSVLLFPLGILWGVWNDAPPFIWSTLAFGCAAAFMLDRSIQGFIVQESHKRSIEMEHWKVRKPAEQRMAHQAALRSRELDRVQAMSLRRLMDPHFIFNALNGIMHDMMVLDWDRALRHLKSFNRLAKHQIQAGHEGWRSMEDEWTTLKDYIELEVRRLDRPIEWELAPLTQHLKKQHIPALLVQPLIENALWHGLGGTSKTGPGRLSLWAEKTGTEHVKVYVCNSPNAAQQGETEPVRPDDNTPRRRHASDLIRQRLNLLDRSGKSSLNMISSAHMTEVHLVVPCTSTR